MANRPSAHSLPARLLPMILTEEQEMIRDTAREFARKPPGAPTPPSGNAPPRFPRAALREMGRLGLLGMTVPAEWGGAGTDYVSYALAMEEIAAGDAATACVMSGHNSVGCMPGRRATARRSRRRNTCGRWRAATYLSAFALTEPTGGSDAAALRTPRGAARRRLCAERHQAVHHHRQATPTCAWCSPAPTRPRASAASPPSSSRRESPGYRVGRIEKKMGQNASDTCEIHFDDIEVPAANRLGAEGQGYRIALSNLEGGRIGIAAQAIGHRARGLRACAGLRAGTQELRQGDLRVPGGVAPPRRDGDADPGGAAAGAARRGVAQPRRCRA